jgi:hypothetical protein
MTEYTVIVPTNEERNVMYSIESYLSEMKWPTVLSSSTRRNIGSTKRHAFCLGSVRKLNVFGELVPSQYNKKHTLLLCMLKKLISLRDPMQTYKQNHITTKIILVPLIASHWVSIPVGDSLFIQMVIVRVCPTLFITSENGCNMMVPRYCTVVHQSKVGTGMPSYISDANLAIE